MIHYLRWTVFLWIVNTIPFTSGMAVNERIGMYAVTKMFAYSCQFTKGLIRRDYVCLVFQALFVSAQEVNVDFTALAQSTAVIALISALFWLSCLVFLYANELFVMKGVSPFFKKQGLLHSYLKFLPARTWRQALDPGGVSQKAPGHIRCGVMCPIELLYWPHSDYPEAV